MSLQHHILYIIKFAKAELRNILAYYMVCNFLSFWQLSNRFTFCKSWVNWSSVHKSIHKNWKLHEPVLKQELLILCHHIFINI